ncbi:mediator of DNA damage checkpoint protein 1 isoform X2 [Corythoichthys intestinalis]|uniref:mediator of DNA damage checkpoint protein 1 isoform X2 n=1 Tax=Corythoichthys intestinalis TaxID=161448 RepID=UPI0025A5C98B|nr:mediator of DNA damage checkpoint protein 1 isoform X2 [Corythoichthys intestinalis]
MEETLQQEVEYKSQNEEEQGGIRRRLRDRELLKRRRAEAEEKETYQSESPKKRQRSEQRRGTKRRGRPRKTERLEGELVDPEAPAVVVFPQSVEAITESALDSGNLEPVSTWLPNPVLTPDPNVELVSPADLVPSTVTVPEAPIQVPSTAADVFTPPTVALATVSDQTSAPDIALPPATELSDVSTSQEQALAPDSDLIPSPTAFPLAPGQDLSPALTSVPDLVLPPTSASPTSELSTASVQNLAPDLIPASAPDVVLVPTPSEVPVSEEVKAPLSIPQQLENLSTESQDRENSDLVNIEDSGPDELKKDAPPIQDKISNEDTSEYPSNNEPEQNKTSTIPLPQIYLPGNQF